MLKQVERAIRDALSAQGDELYYAPDHHGGELIDGFIDIPAVARAAIAAMREPTEAMIETAGGCNIDDITAAVAWRAMIGAVLADNNT